MYDTYIVKRTQIYLDDQQDQLLERRAEAAGTTKSAVIRDAIDAFLSGESGADAVALERFRSAVNDAAGIAGYLPTGSDYVDAVRAADSNREAELETRRSR
jgi:predicted DNA-binding protein